MKTLRSKILLYFGSSTTIIILLLVLVIKNQIASTNIPLTKDLNQQVVTARSEQLGEWVEQRICEIRILTETKTLISMEEDKVKPFMRRMDNLHKEDFESFAVVDLDGQAWVTNDTHIDISNRPYFKKMNSKELDYVISDPIISHSNEEPIIVINHAIKGLNNNTIGYLNGAIYLDKLSQIAKEIEMYNGKAWIKDSSGNIFTKTPHGISESMNVLESREIGYEGFDKVGKKMLNGKEGIHTIKTPQDEKRIVIHSPIPNTDGWSLGIDFSKSEMTKDTNQLMFTVIAFGGIIIAVLIIISLVLSSSIANPITHLRKLMKKAEQGDLDVTFDYDTKDEIGHLGAGFNNMIKKIKKLITLLEKEHQEKRKTELQVLQSQIKPHFLYNTLDTIRWSILEDDSQEAVELLEELSTFYRIGLDSGNEYITIEKELDHIESYLRLQKARYEDMLNYQVKYDEAIVSYNILKLILQPIVENAILHGSKNHNYSTCEIILELTKEDNDLVITIKNNGASLSSDKLQKIKTALKTNEKPGEDIGFGLYSTNMRIKLAYGNNYGLDIDAEKGFTKVTIRYPLVKGED
ncbi:cache domain-containing sensor histidine kinase [Natranaerobius trueperi]|uniref:HAMP domain-containing protein n=1 Tax=Natranaerobius trueperi TaxID=759412 RepID=A0A226C181_9FIRM|nr:sensor histidine kinase [Natranaerobius trueperi]OWZ85048.1 hypothetical protein CDO51_01235 [Natranaerobius trueperi]